MRLFLLTTLTMVAFAANSVLNRLALDGGETGPASFALIRLVAGAVMLMALVARRQGGLAPVARWPGRAGPGMLALYVLGFSFAYVTLGAGVGALILFGGVQVTMFAGAVLARETIPVQRWLGAGLSFAGLGYLMWPAGGTAPDLIGAALMAAAALGWGIYSLIGRGARDPLGATAANFLWAAPVGVLVWVILPDSVDAAGAGLAVLSGAITSGLGYALWYTVLPGLGASRAAVAQLTVPVIAIAGGVVFLGEELNLRVVLASIMVLGGVGLANYAFTGRPRR
ncbi:DMT family transporter [Alisedimentitalea sp. MJ-SS2]|uniref:DMT family transporter n=1 Tax=Aliisedimentitalea sp. MJ-SS2 TaxID=3049795 RepID=UPI00290A8D03|nr:DMT family transporter [Alisedimentitalea sp. MJ-SS2]MDU8927251.1 DMT family transporter [Alisedimentitalea sp. MJ-SS2]